jgi:hypothetical protein
VSTSEGVVTTTPWRLCGCDCRVVIVTVSLLRARGVCGGGWARVRWASGDDDAVAIVRSRSSCRHRHCVTVASARGVRGRVGQGEVGKW